MQESHAGRKNGQMAIGWDDLRVLLAVADGGSLGAAAKLLKVDPSTVSRRLAALEAGLGVQLVVRLPEGLQLSAAGVRAAEGARTVDRTIAELEAAIAGADALPRGTVRVSVSDGFAPVLYDGLARLRQEHPEICVDLVIDSGRTDILRHQADIAVRLFRDTQPDLVVRKVGEIGWSVYASPGYIARCGLPSLDDLRAHEIVGFADAAARSPGARWLEARADAARVVMRGSSVLAVLNAVNAGLGIAPLPCSMTRGSELVRLTPGVVTSSEAFLVTAPDLRDVARIKIVLEALGEVFAQQRALLAGQVAAEAA